ncbi:hypothetical protein L6164_022197 [Bauhinia variegata]|uniref:Uncharacterized protein n=1 Tax=Bauhinia variegata TaxID=167791 RepID=A0ACB9MGB6_BAUVA|nr:hypothetical protein L6164_022197 [Bauhinia variegata]
MNSPARSDNHDDQTDFADLVSNYVDSTFPSYAQESGPFPSQDLDMDDRFENVDEFLFLNLGFSSEVHPVSEDGSTLKSKQPKTKRQTEVDLDFTNFLGKNMPDIFCPPKNPKSLLLPESQPPCSTKLPEDCHYHPEDLVKLFLLPNVKCLGRRARKFSDGPREQCNDYGSFSSWDDSVCGGDYDGDVHSDIEDSSTLISQPRQVVCELLSHCLACFTFDV